MFQPQFFQPTATSTRFASQQRSATAQQRLQWTAAKVAEKPLRPTPASFLLAGPWRPARKQKKGSWTDRSRWLSMWYRHIPVYWHIMYHDICNMQLQINSEIVGTLTSRNRFLANPRSELKSVVLPVTLMVAFHSAETSSKLTTLVRKAMMSCKVQL